jgi:hypothetical protein
MKFPGITLFIILIISLATQHLYAWEAEVGVRQQMPRIGVGEQEYEDESGNNRSIKPGVETTAIGFSYHIGIRFEEYSIDMDIADYKYDSSIDASNDAVTGDTQIEVKTIESRIGINYHLERELAGILVGLGLSRITETLESDDNTWTFQSTSPYLKVGCDLIFSAFRARYEQIYISMGEHSVQINSLGFFLVF